MYSPDNFSIWKIGKEKPTITMYHLHQDNLHSWITLHEQIRIMRTWMTFHQQEWRYRCMMHEVKQFLGKPVSNTVLTCPKEQWSRMRYFYWISGSTSCSLTVADNDIPHWLCATLPFAHQHLFFPMLFGGPCLNPRKTCSNRRQHVASQIQTQDVEKKCDVLKRSHLPTKTSMVAEWCFGYAPG